MRVAVQITVVTVSGTESAHGTEHPPAPEIVDAAGDRWSIAVGGLMVKNGQQAAYDLWQRLLWWNHDLFAQRRQDRGANWYKRGPGTWGWEFQLSADPRTGEPPPPPPPPPPPENRAPTWNMADIIFEQGVPAAIDLRTRAIDPDNDPLLFNVVTGLRSDLVGAFAFNDFTLYYDGRDLGALKDGPPITLDSGITISANDGR